MKTIMKKKSPLIDNDGCRKMAPIIAFCFEIDKKKFISSFTKYKK